MVLNPGFSTIEMPAENAYSIHEIIARISDTEKNCIESLATGEQIDEENETEETHAKQHRPPFRFPRIGLKPGDIVEFVDNAAKKAVGIDDRHVEYESVTASLSPLAEKLTGLDHALQNPLYSSCRGDLLTDHQTRMENSINGQ